MGHIHGEGEYDYTASAMIVFNEKVLLLFHKKLQLWLPPSGHIELNETPVEGLYREITEETGITREHLTAITPFKDNFELKRDDVNRTEPLPFDVDIHPLAGTTHRHIDYAYVFISDTGTITREEAAAEHLAWFSPEEVEKLSPMPQSIRSRVKYALAKVKEFQQ